MKDMNEAERMKQAYDQRKSNAKLKGIYSPFKRDVLQNTQRKERELIRFLSQKFNSLADVKILEIGAGNGQNLLRFLLYGARPENLFYNEMLADRIEHGKRLLPQQVTFLEGDAGEIDKQYDGFFDIIYVSTVFSSILSDQIRAKLAQRIWTLLKSGGIIIWYDFIFDNPKNSDVRKVPLSELKALFPEGAFHNKRITLAPPIARRIQKAGWFFLTIFDIPPLRSHLLAMIEKKA